MMYDIGTTLRDRANRLSEYLADFLEDAAVERLATRWLDLLVETAIRAFAVVFIISIILTIGPTIESRFAGVLVNWSAANFVKDGKAWNFDVYATKPSYRFNCSYVKDQSIDARAIVRDGTRDETVAGRLEFRIPGKLVQPEQSSDTREYFGHWSFTPESDVPPGSIIYGSIRHNCHFLWVSTTVFGPFEIKIDHKE